MTEYQSLSNHYHYTGVGLQRGGKIPVNFWKVSGKFPWEVKLGKFGNIPDWKLSMGIMGIYGN